MTLYEGMRKIADLKAAVEEQDRFLLFLSCNPESLFLVDKDSEWILITTKNAGCQETYFNMGTFSHYWPEAWVTVLAAKRGSYYDGGGNSMNLKHTDMWRLTKIDLEDTTAYLGGLYVSVELMKLLKK